MIIGGRQILSTDGAVMVSMQRDRSQAQEGKQVPLKQPVHHRSLLVST